MTSKMPPNLKKSTRYLCPKCKKISTMVRILELTASLEFNTELTQISDKVLQKKPQHATK